MGYLYFFSMGSLQCFPDLHAKFKGEGKKREWVKHGRSNNGDVEGAEEDKEWGSISTPREVPSSCSAVVALMVGCCGLAAALLTVHSV